jgi:bacillithiol biosynthesis deacetylase BshB1
MDLLAIGAHPDDCELFAGGLLAALCANGRRVAVCDLTRGEAASRGTAGERAVEARRAADILGLAERVALDLGDGTLENTPDSRRQVVEVIRRLRPSAVLTHHGADRHPDHSRAHDLVRQACFYATVGKLEAAGERLERPPVLFYFFGNTQPGQIHPDFIVPIDSAAQTKQRAIAAYASQFYNPDRPEETLTMIASRDYAEAMAARDRLFGHAVGARGGEPYALDCPPAVPDPLAQLFGL